jgi:hypothetical protein
VKKFLDVKGIVTIVAAAGLLAVAGYAFEFNELKGEVTIIKSHYGSIVKRLDRIELILMEGRDVVRRHSKPNESSIRKSVAPISN